MNKKKSDVLLRSLRSTDFKPKPASDEDSDGHRSGKGGSDWDDDSDSDDGAFNSSPDNR